VNAYRYVIPIGEGSTTRLDWTTGGMLVAMSAVMPLTFGVTHCPAGEIEESVLADRAGR